MNNTIPFHSATRTPQITVDVNILTMLKQAASCLTEAAGRDVYLAAIGPDMELTIIMEEDAPSILPCFDEDDALISVKGAPLFISYNPAQVLKLAGKRYLTGPVIFYRTDGHSTIVSLTVEDPEITDTGVSYAIRLSTLQVNTTKASNFVLQASMLYAAVVLMVICLTVLSLQQLLDASQYKYRFSVLRKLGVEDTHIGKLVLKQLGIWFGLPIVVAIIVSSMVIIYFIQTISAEISAYIGFGALMSQIGMTVSILALLLICYFISTWLLFKKSIK